MTLGFQTRWPAHMGELAGQPNYFVDKIWKGFCWPSSQDDPLYWTYYNEYLKKINRDFTNDKWNATSDKAWNEILPKCHTIRTDPHDRWKPGMKIHMVINNRTKNRFQFAPVLECVGVQKIQIRWFDEYPSRVHGATPRINGRYVSIRIDNHATGSGMVPYEDWLLQLAKNDGFPSVEAFFQYFNKDFSGKIIHWTGLGY